MPDGPDCVSSHHPELIDIPVWVVGLVQDGHLDISVVDGVCVERPVLVALLSALLIAPGEHHDGPGVRLPAHSPEVVPRGMKGTLGHYELPLRVEAGDEAGVDEVAALLIICWLQLHSTVVVRQDVREPDIPQ